MIYVGIILILIFFTFSCELKISGLMKFSILIISSFILILLAGLRGPIEGDYLAYEDIFKISSQVYSSDLGIEPLYFFLNKIINLIGLPFQFVIVIVAIISIIPKFIFFYKESLNFGFTVLVYFCTVYFIFDFIQIRQGLTIALFIISLKYIYEKSLIKYILVIILATSIHISSIILLPGYFIFNRRYKKNILYTIIIVCAYINILQITSPFLEFSLNYFPIPNISTDKIIAYSKATNFSPVTIKQLILGFFFVYVRDKNFTNTKYLNLFVNLFIIGILLTTLFNGISELAFRVKWYFFWTESILIVYLVYYFGLRNIFLKYVLYLGLAILYVISLYAMLDEFASRGPYIFPYKTIFEF